jgi:hypothetical protein
MSHKGVKKTNQHYVWRAYLKPWSSDGQIYCLRNGTIRFRSLRRVASADLFYSIPEILSSDVAQIEHLAIERSPEGLKKIHRSYVAQCRKPWIIKRFLEKVSLEEFKKIDLKALGYEGDDLNHEKFYEGARVAADEAISNDEEDYLSRMENAFQPHLESLLKGDTSFYGDAVKAGEFITFISIQYLRTKKIREGMADTFNASLKDFVRLWTIYAHIFSINVSRSFFGAFRGFKIIVAENLTDVPFITGDQPVFNLHGNPLTRDVPEEMELYYPLSPTKAMFYVKVINNDYPATITDSADVEKYNILIAQHAHEQIYGDSKKALARYGQYLDPLP